MGTIVAMFVLMSLLFIAEGIRHQLVAAFDLNAHF